MQQHTSLPTTLPLIRHAQAAERDPESEQRLSGQIDLELTRHGRIQAERLRHLASRPRHAIDAARPLAE